MGYTPYPTTEEERSRGLLSCRCGLAFPLRDVPTGAPLWVPDDGPRRRRLEGPWSEFMAVHRGAGHRVDVDRYRPPCRPAAASGGCRECGAAPRGGMLFYCSAEHREAFERDHFWGAARLWATTIGSTFMLEITRGSYWGRGEQDGRGQYHRREHVICRRCQEPAQAWEINHVEPVNGRRRNFGCEHHQSNLEVVCRACHLTITAEQRAAGLLGPPPDAAASARRVARREAARAQQAFEI